jgi:transcription-repair coupling factor (superfamily II helicase)
MITTLVNNKLPKDLFFQSDTSLSHSIGKYFQEFLKKDQKSLNIITCSVFDAVRIKEEIKWFFPDLKINLLPDWETLPYDQISPHPDLISERLLTLYQMTKKEFDINLIPVTTALHLVTPREYIEKYSFQYKKNENVDLESFKERLINNGYLFVEKVIHPGEYAIRGGLIDLFPMGSMVPYRIDFFDTQIDSIRTFDPDTQRSLYPTNEIKLLPARECPIDELGIKLFRQNYREKFEGDPSRSKIYKSISKGIPFAGMEWYLPLFFESTDTIFDYLDINDPIFVTKSLASASQNYWSEAEKRFSLYAYDIERPILQPNNFLIPSDIFFKNIDKFQKLKVKKNLPDIFSPDISIDRANKNPLKKLQSFILGKKHKILISAEGLGRRETLGELLTKSGIKFSIVENWKKFTVSKDKVNLITSPLHTGFISKDICVVTENEIFPNFIKQPTRKSKDKNFNSDIIVKDLTELDIGDPVVHEQYGVGRYQGLSSLDFDEEQTEFLSLCYKGDTKLYVPVSQLHLISRYSGGPIESAPLNSLGNSSWDKAKKKALIQIHDTAAELLSIYAKRSLQKGTCQTVSLTDYESFVEGFAFEETPDQLEAIENVIKDLETPRPMDRLVCGDVGFGKTEVALRAAFISVMNSKQVVILVPTTLLAEQHFNTFIDRFAKWPIKIEEISRFKTKKQQNESLANLKEGKVDIIIGTHRLLQDDVVFKNLGLVIIDEEHRFGVRQKENLKSYRANIDVLTLTATPIPRTLSMAMEGLREFSIIATPPQKRLSIKTFVYEFNTRIIREAVLREFNRGGQVYFLHNEVNTIQSMHERLTKLLPEAKIGVAHGQLREKELEHVMQDFNQQKINILLCTTIIENGIDIPTANTIIMNRADKFGLGQLHQLRGRVGRSHHQAYAYLLLDQDKKISFQAKKRLDAIQLLEDLGAGYYLAIQDLEIRGAGDLLGDNQSGQIHEIGFNLYIDMLNQTVKEIKLGKKLDLNAPLSKHKEINLHAPTILPESYCRNINERLIVYKRLSDCKSNESLNELKEELIDRFGIMPDQTKNLIITHQLRVDIDKYDVIKIDASASSVEITFQKNANIDAVKLIDLIQSNKAFKMNGPDKIKAMISIEDLNERSAYIRKLLSDVV